MTSDTACTDRAALCQALDNVTDEVMKTITQILQRQTRLDSQLESGYFMMAKARYSMGQNRISALQHHHDDLEEAGFKVTVEEDDQAAVTFLPNSVSNNLASTEQVSGLRKRKTNVDSHVEDLSCKLEDISLDEKQNTSAENTEANTNHQGSKCKNPINWFGVLIPQALRQCQNDFKRAIEEACHLASLKDLLIKLKRKQRNLMEQKIALGPAVVEDEQTDDAILTDSDDYSILSDDSS